MIKYPGILFYLLLPVVFIFTSCQNKTQQLLVKKWDCVKIENLAPIDVNIISKEDSIAAQKLQTALQELIWTFNSDNTYLCNAGNITTVQGKYTINDADKTLALTSNSQNSTNTYAITSLTSTDMVLTAIGTEVPLILRFKVH